MTIDRIEEHVSLASLVYDTAAVTDRPHFAWKHCASPYGASTCVALRTNEAKLVGRMLLPPRPFVTGSGAVLSGATITDFVLAPEHRSALQIISMIKAAKAPSGISLVLHSSNDVSDPLYSQLFKFKREFSLRALGIPVRLNRIMRRYTSVGVICKALDMLMLPARVSLRLLAQAWSFRTGISYGPRPPEAEVDIILREFKASAGPHFERTAAFLKWRFLESPLFPGHVDWLWREGECLGYMAWQQVEKRGLQVFAITDLVTRRPLTAGHATAVKLLATRLCIERGLDAVFTLANVGNPMLAHLPGFPFLPIPVGQLPHPSPIYLHADRTCFPSEHRARTYLTLADLDYF